MNSLSEAVHRISSAKHVQRHLNTRLNKVLVTVSPGGLYITDQDEVISTVLGSCITVCAHDVARGIGGMNHFMVPGDAEELSNNNQEELLRLGIYSLPYLFEQLYSLGAQKNSLEVKVFGGGAIISTTGDVGKANIDFAMQYIRSNELNLVSYDVGGKLPRKVNYMPVTGQVYMKRLRALHKKVVAKREGNPI